MSRARDFLHHVNTEMWMATFSEDISWSTKHMGYLIRELRVTARNTLQTQRVLYFMETYCFLENVIHAFVKLRGDYNATADEFYIVICNLLRMWGVRSGKARYRMLQGGFLGQCILPVCDLNLSKKARIAVAGFICLFLDGICDRFYFRTSDDRIKEVTVALFKVVYPVRDLHMDKIYDRYHARFASFKRCERTRKIVGGFARTCGRHLKKRVSKLSKISGALEYYQEIRNDSPGWVLRKKMTKLIEANDKVEQQAEVETKLKLLSFMIAKTDNAARAGTVEDPDYDYEQEMVDNENVRKRKLGSLPGMDLGHLVARRVFKFAKVDFGVESRRIRPSTETF